MRISVSVFLSLVASCSLSAGAIAGDGRIGILDQPALVINELMARNASAIADEHGDYDDWVELYNCGDEAIDTGGWYLSDDPAAPTKWRIPTTRPTLTTVPGHGYLVIWADNETAEGPLHASWKLNNAGETLSLYDAQEGLLDSVTFRAQAADTSYGRFPDGGGSWQTFAAATPGKANAAAAGGIVISEIMYHPYHPVQSSENTRQEWLELFNRGADPIDLTGWRFADGIEYAFPDLVLKGGEYLVVAADVNVFSTTYPGVGNVVGGWTGWLSNSGERLELVDRAGTVVNEVRYADEGDWAVRELGPLDFSQRGWQWSNEHDGQGQSLELVNPALPNEFGQNWRASFATGGTPGAANSVAAADLAPMILDVHHAPIIPGPAEAVTVTARLCDEQTTGVFVTLYYRPDTSTYAYQDVYPQYRDASWRALPMFDDGGHGDGRADDGVFAAQIPAQPNGQIVEFYVGARDAAGNVRTWPAPSLMDGVPQQVTNALYQVDASFDPAAAWLPTDPPVYFLLMTENERGRLADIGNGRGAPGSEDDSDSNARMNGTFISVDGTGMELHYRVGIRNRGKGSRDTASDRYRNNYRVDFPTDGRWKDVSAINIKNRFGYVAVLGSAVWRMANLPAERIIPIQVRVNGQNWAFDDSRMFGSYATVEVMDDEFAARHFPSDREGNLYRCTNDRADLGYDGPNPASYYFAYEKQTNVAANDYNDLIRLTYVLNNTPPERLVQEVRAVIHLDQWLRFIAVDALCGNREGGLTTPRGDDYAVYSGVLDPRFWLIPHDLDTLFGQGDNAPDINRSVHVYAGLDGLHELLTHPDILPLYHAQLLELINTVFAPERFDPLVDQVLGGWVPEATRSSIKQFVAQRNAIVLGQIPRQLTISSPLPVVDGYPYTTARTYSLSGTAHAAQTRSVLVNGVPATWLAQDGRWQTGGAFASAESLVGSGSEWRFLDDGSDQGTAWQRPGFDDSAWRSGRAQLGYGDGDEATVVNSGPAGSRYLTAYFRKSFTASSVSGYLAVRLRLLRDDGAVVYLNGAEVCRSGLPAGPVDYMTPATANVGGAEESAFVEYDLPPGLLREGANTLAVEVHQFSGTSSDLSFDLALEATRRGVEEGALLPGINRIIVESFDSRDGAGHKVEEAYVDIWYDDGGVVPLSGALSADKVLQADAGPWQVTSTVTVPAGRTLSVEPGATLFFDPGTSLVVNGRLLAEGTPYRRITFTRAPGGTSWAGLQFVDAPEESRLAYVNMEYSDAGSSAIRADHAGVYLDHVIWGNHAKPYLTFENSSLVLKNSILPSIQDDELVHFLGLPSDGRALFEGNWFGATTGYNDIIDFTGGQRPGPIARFIDNTFTGGSDDCIDLDGADAHVEGNVFVHVHGDGASPGESHAVTTGAAQGQYSELTVVRNLFYDVDHAMLCKDGGFITAVNNTVVHATDAAVNMYEMRSGQWQGRGFYGDGNIFHDVAHVFESPDWVGHPTAITMNNSIFPVIADDPIVWAGAGNLEDVDPQLYEATEIDDPAGDLRLLPSSPALGTGPNGRDMGGSVPPGASIAGTPFPVTWKTQATLTVGGPDIFSYRYRVNEGPWSAEVLRPDAGLPGDPKPLPPITLTDLQNGQSYTVFVVGKDSAGVWQSEDSPTASRAWTVDTSYQRVVINEVLALNESVLEHAGAFPDLVELYYDGPAAMSLSGMSLSDDPEQPAKFVFPAGVTIRPEEYLVVFADTESAAPGLHLGFGLDVEGDGVYLFDAAGTLIDSVEFGAQLPDLSAGRVGAEGTWRLTIPTLGQANLAQPLGDPRGVRINEWLASEAVLFGSDFIELYNPHPLPVDLGGFYVTDTPETEPARHRLRPLTFIPGEGYVVFEADDELNPGHLGFKLSSGGEMIALFDAAFREIDKVILGSQTTDVSQGRSPDGSGQFEYFVLPTPGLPNSALPMATGTTLDLVLEGAAKRAIIPTAPGDVPDTWKADPAFNDSSWLSASGAPGGVGFERSSGYETLISLDVEGQMYGRNATCYVRIPFRVEGDAIGGLTELYLSIRYDDGFVAYLSGVEVGRVNFAGTPQWNSAATGSHEANPQAFDPVLDLSDRIDLLHAGSNLLAIQALNSSTTGSDFVISAALQGMSVTGADSDYPYLKELDLLDGLRITELMYNAPQGDDGDYIELQNIGGVPLDLTGVRFTAGVDFNFPPLMLAPGECVVVAGDPVSFQSSYGTGIKVVGPYTGRLGNNGENIVLRLAAPLEAAIMRFRYADAWYPATDGGGEALVIADPTAAAATWDDPASWRSAPPTPGKP